MRGTKHAMGGHTIAENGYVIDMEKLDNIQYNVGSDRIRVGSGTLWSKIIFYLNRFGLSLQTLQSYSTFRLV